MVFQDPYAGPQPAQADRIHRRRGLPGRTRSAPEGRIERARPNCCRSSGLYPDATATVTAMNSRGGQRQRIGVTRALARQPQADRPVTSRCLPSTCPCRRRSSTCSRTSSRDFGLTYVFIAHDLSVVRHVSDRVARDVPGQDRWRSGNRASSCTASPGTRTPARLLSAAPIADPERRARAGADHARRRRPQPDQPAERLSLSTRAAPVSTRGAATSTRPPLLRHRAGDTRPLPLPARALADDCRRVCASRRCARRETSSRRGERCCWRRPEHSSLFWPESPASPLWGHWCSASCSAPAQNRSLAVGFSGRLRPAAGRVLAAGSAARFVSAARRGWSACGARAGCGGSSRARGGRGRSTCQGLLVLTGVALLALGPAVDSNTELI